MPVPPPESPEHAALIAALRRDAARVPQPEFDPHLHGAVCQRLAALTETPPTWWSTWRWPAPVALTLLLASLAIWSSRAQQGGAAEELAYVLAESRQAVTKMSARSSAALSAWESPTASLLSPPRQPSLQPTPQL